MTEQPDRWQRFLASLVWGILYTLSLMPIWVWYRISDFLFLLVYFVIRYRKEVVRKNLEGVFPDKSPAEIRQLMWKFYRHLCDLPVELIKDFSMSDAEMLRRVSMVNPEVGEEAIAAQQGTLLLASHCNNFEWLYSRLLIYNEQRVEGWVVYSPFHNYIAEEIFRRLRQRRGLNLARMSRVSQLILDSIGRGAYFTMVIDQSPHPGKPMYFTRFLNRLSPFHTSAARIALHTRAPVYFLDMRKVRRGHYEIRLEKLDPTPYYPEDVYGLTDYFARVYETQIFTQPESWLWTHKRWKHKPREQDVVREERM